MFRTAHQMAHVGEGRETSKPEKHKKVTLQELVRYSHLFLPNYKHESIPKIPNQN